MVKTRRFEGVELDETDTRLIEALSENGRTSLADLGRLVGMSPQSAAERVRRLEDLGVISGVSVILDPAALGLGIAAYIRIQPALGEVKRVAKLVAEIPEIVECDRVTGDDCFIAKVFVSRVEELERVIDILLPYARTNTSIVQSTPVPRRQPRYSR